MKALSLKKINSSAPYKVYGVNEDSYTFVTDQGVQYVISFIEEFELGGCMSYQFSIRNKNKLHGSYDMNIRQTIIAIIEEFFSENLNVLLYICDTSDNREEARNRLFIQWFKKFADPSHYTICSADTVVEQQGFYTAIIVENRNPKLESIKQDYLYTAEKLKSK